MPPRAKPCALIFFSYPKVSHLTLQEHPEASQTLSETDNFVFMPTLGNVFSQMCRGKK